MNTERRCRLVSLVATILVSGILAHPARASFEIEPERLPSTVDRVTIYRDLVSVERSTPVSTGPGERKLVGVVVPHATGVARDSIRVTAEGAASVQAVDVIEVESVSAAATGLRELEDRLALAILERDGVESDLELFESIATRLVDQASAEFGTLDFNLDLARRQLAALRSDRSELMRTLLERRREVDDLRRQVERATAAGVSSSARSVDLMVLVELASESGGDADLLVRYQRADAGWSPVYSLRSSASAKTGSLEYMADIVQATGEDWRNVEAVLSTARPSAPRQPPSLRPVFVDRIRPRPDDSRGFVSADSPVMELASSVDVEEIGTSLQFTLPDRIDVASDADATTRVAITSVDTPIELVRVAIPLIDDRVYVRADAINDSDVAIVPGDVSLYFDDEYVGGAFLEEVQPGAAFEVWLGPDPMIRTARLVLDRETERTGLLGGGRQTSIETRIELEHLGAGSVEVEVWDRRPTSRDEDIEVNVGTPSPALATDESYLRTEARMGLLKWVVTLGPAGSETATQEILWTLRVNRSADIDMTPIPE